MRMQKLLGSVLVMALALVWPGASFAQPVDDRPNILLIMGDDYGWPYYGFMWEHLGDTLERFRPGDPTPECPLGSDETDWCQMRIATPNLDRLAKEGVVFGHGYSAETACQPAHQSLYTGLQQRDLAERNNLVGCDYGGTKHGPQTFPEALRDAGYATFYAGRFYGPKSSEVWTGQDQDREVGERKSLAGLKEFISEQQAGHPWFAMWTPLSPHQEFSGVPKHIENDYFRWPTLGDPIMETKNPPHIESVYTPSSTRDYFESITYFDERIGEIVEFLELLEARSCDLGADHLAEFGLPPPIGPMVHDPGDMNNPNPLTRKPGNERIVKDVICTSTPGQPCPSAPSCVPNVQNTCKPNPYYDPYGKLPTVPVPPGANTTQKCEGTAPPDPRYAGFRRNTLIIYVMDNGSGIQHSKGQFSENGLRTPIILNYPNRIPPLGRLSENDTSVYPHPALVGSIDIFPTVLEYAEIDARTFPDARSLVPLVENPWQTYPAGWRRYFYSNLSASATSMLAVTDSVLSAPFQGVARQFKIEANNDVTQAVGVKRISDLTTDPFENGPSKPAEYLPTNPNGPKYEPGHVPPGESDLVVPHLQKVLDSWDRCMGTCERCRVVTELAEGACGSPLEVCDGGCAMPTNLPCKYFPE